MFESSNERLGLTMIDRDPEANIHSSLPDCGQVSLATFTVPVFVVSELKWGRVYTS